MGIAEKLTQIAENEQKVYDKGVEDGKTMGDYGKGFEDGKKAEYDAFWDTYQQNGKRNNYQYGAFGGDGWTDEIYKPKYPVKVMYGYSMFTGCRLTEIKDIDFSLADTLKQIFNVSYELQKIGVINAPLCYDMDTCFSNCRALHTIEKIKVSEQCAFRNCFAYCYALENITFESEIGNDINFQWSTKLSKDSITSIINHLSDTASGKTLTLSLTAVSSAFGASAMDWDGDGTIDGWVGGTEEWNALISSKSNWNIIGV